jgi:hypothetical protein
MFGLDPITLALLGGAIGGLTNKKDPVMGAMMGAAGGGMGGLLGGPAAAAAAPAGGAAGGTGLTLGAAGQGLQAAGSAASSGLGAAAAPVGGIGLLPPTDALAAGAAGTVAPKSAIDSALGILKPAGEAASTAQKFGLLQPESQKPVVQAPPFSTGSPQGPQGLTNLVTQQKQTGQERMARDLEERLRRQEMIMRMGGGYGLTR